MIEQRTHHDVHEMLLGEVTQAQTQAPTSSGFDAWESMRGCGEKACMSESGARNSGSHVIRLRSVGVAKGSPY